MKQANPFALGQATPAFKDIGTGNPAFVDKNSPRPSPIKDIGTGTGPIVDKNRPMGMPPAQANISAMSQTAARNAAMQSGKSQIAPLASKEVMPRPPTLQPIPSGAMGGQAIKTGINPENRNINQTMGTGIIAAQMNRPA